MKILEAFGEPISFGGQEAFVMNMLEHMDRTGLEFDLLTPYYCDNERTEAVIRSYGGKIHSLGCRFNPGKVRANVIRPIRRFLRENRYDAIHIHSGSNSMLAIYAEAAYAAGIGKIIVHSHSTGNRGWKHSVSKAITAPILSKCPTEYFACSDEAGSWRFPRRICDERLRVIYNGIEADDFRYDAEVRMTMRESLGVDDDTILIGNIGRLVYQKNQEYLLDLLRLLVEGVRDSYPVNKEYDTNHKAAAGYKLLLVGDGEDMDRLRQRASELGIEDLVIFTGARNNVCDYYQAIDVLAVPSHYEGLGMVVIEGQAAGLDVLVSDRVPHIAAVTDQVEFLPLGDPDAWLRCIRKDHQRHPGNTDAVTESGFSAEKTAASVRSIYLS